MGKRFSSISNEHQRFIEAQKIFFVATAAENGSINLSPKGMDTFRCAGPNEVGFLNLTGSGNETAAHLRLKSRITFMFCSFDESPLILRLRGTARALYPNDHDWEEWAYRFPAHPGTRQIIASRVDSVQTSCGYAVPFMEFKGERPTLRKWAERKGPEGIRDYWKEKNLKSIDNFDTGIFE